MPQYTFLPGREYHDLEVDVTFAERLPPAAVTGLLTTLIDSVPMAARLEVPLDGIVHMSMGEADLALRLRFSAVTPDAESEDLGHRRMHFVLYLFARIDAYHRLGATPFPADFRDWLRIEEEYDLE